MYICIPFLVDFDPQTIWVFAKVVLIQWWDRTTRVKLATASSVPLTPALQLSVSTTYSTYADKDTNYVYPVYNTDWRKNLEQNHNCVSNSQDFK